MCVALTTNNKLGILLCSLFFFSSSTWAQSSTPSLEQTSASQTASTSEATASKPLPKVKIKTTLGDIVLELYPEKAPKTVENFLRYVKKGHYNKTIFHRVIDNFMIQGGGLDLKMSEKPTDAAIINEAGKAFEQGLKNDIGTIAMARMQDPNSAKAQFYINVNNNDFLNYQPIAAGDPVVVMKNGEPITLPRSRALVFAAGYTPFGKVTEGWETVEKIKGVATGESGIYQNVPNKPITIVSIQVVK
mgnify:CR=1 FL=1